MDVHCDVAVLCCLGHVISFTKGKYFLSLPKLAFHLHKHITFIFRVISASLSKV